MSEVVRRGPGRPGKCEKRLAPHTVLEQALAAFAGQGYDAVSLRKLSADLGMGHTFVSDRYGSKEELWKAVVEHAMSEWLAVVNVALTSDDRDDAERLVGSVRALHRAAAGSSHFARLIDQEARTESPRLAYLHEMLQPVNETLKSLFERMVADGRLRPMPWYLFYFLTTSPTSLYSQPPLARLLGRPDNADDHDLVTDLILGGLMEPTHR